MFKKIANIFYLIFFFIFIFSITKYYFSDQNIKLTNKSRSSYSLVLNIDKHDLPLLENDTNDVIVNKNDLEEFKRKRKKFFNLDLNLASHVYSKFATFYKRTSRVYNIINLNLDVASHVYNIFATILQRFTNEGLILHHV